MGVREGRKRVRVREGGEIEGREGSEKVGVREGRKRGGENGSETG